MKIIFLKPPCNILYLSWRVALWLVNQLRITYCLNKYCKGLVTILRGWGWAMKRGVGWKTCHAEGGGGHNMFLGNFYVIA